LQERFVAIQAGIQDEHDALMEDIAMKEAFCEDTNKTLRAQIVADEKLLGEAETKLSYATEKEATAGEDARQMAIKHDSLDKELKETMEKCSENYIDYETQICALKKIRGELYKIAGGGHSAFFVDCELSTWAPGECTKKCNDGSGGGEQKLERTILTKSDGGVACDPTKLPLATERSCNNDPCPVNCELKEWTGWSKCSAECGGGVRQRLREVSQAPRNGGEPCGETSETKACNIEACEKDCELHDWAAWSACSKDCDGGTQKRQKYVKFQPEGQGTCADEWDMSRLQYKECNVFACELPVGKSVIPCNKTIDIVLLLDGSGSLGQEGWDAEIKAADLFVDAFTGTGAHARMAAILYSGPSTWAGVSKCMGTDTEVVDMESFCKIKVLTHFTEDMAAVKSAINGATWPKGSTLTSVALMAAKSEFSLGREHANTNVILFTDGKPLSSRKTLQAAKVVREAGRLVWVPVTAYAPLDDIKKWATRRWEENVVEVPTFEDLESPWPINQIIADICPKEEDLFAYEHWR
jgi:hypothetical protein